MEYISPSASHFFLVIDIKKFFVLSGPALAGVSTQSNNPAVVGMGTFSTASYATLKMRKDVELWEICHSTLSKVPKAYNKVSAYSLQTIIMFKYLS